MARSKETPRELSAAIANGEMGVQKLVIDTEMERVTALLAEADRAGHAASRAEFAHQSGVNMFRYERSLPETPEKDPTDLTIE